MTQSFTSLYKRYSKDVYRFALYLSGERSEAEDITAETFARVWSATEPIVMATVKGYLFTIARHLFLKGLRSRSKRVALPEDLHDPQAGPDIRAANCAQLQAVIVALQQIPEASRSALLMHAVDGMTYEEIARVIGISLPAVKIKIHRARLALLTLKDT
jgi:RNA polymerase sigma-70 factor (ECF subfamily)